MHVGWRTSVEAQRLLTARPGISSSYRFQASRLWGPAESSQADQVPPSRSRPSVTDPPNGAPGGHGNCLAVPSQTVRERPVADSCMRCPAASADRAELRRVVRGIWVRSVPPSVSLRRASVIWQLNHHVRGHVFDLLRRESTARRVGETGVGPSPLRTRAGGR